MKIKKIVKLTSDSVLSFDNTYSAYDKCAGCGDLFPESDLDDDGKCKKCRVKK